MEDQTSAVSPVAAAVAAVEAKNGTATEVGTKPEVANPNLEIFARKEAALQKQRQELEAREQTWKQKLADYENGYISKDALKQDPLSVLEEAGWTYEQLTDMLVNQPNITDPTIRALKAEINKLKQTHTEAQTKAEQAAQAQYQQAVKQMTTEVKMLIDGNDAYETVREAGMHEAVVQLVTDTFEKEGYLMDLDEAAKQVEEHLLAEAEKMTSWKKLQERLKAKQTPIEAPVSAAPVTGKSPTITNAVTAPSKPSSEKDRIARAMAAFQGKLSQ
jgi:hypothetical protein